MNFEEYTNSLLHGSDLDFNKDGTEVRRHLTDDEATSMSEKAKMLQAVFKNTFETVNDATVEPYVSYPNFNRDVMVPLIRHTFPHLIAHEISGIQPVSAIDSKILTLRVKYRDKQDVENSLKEAENTTFGLDPKLPNVNKSMILEAIKSSGNRLIIDILQEDTKAVDTPYHAKWSPISLDAKAKYPDINLDAEVLAAISQELLAEIDQDHLTKLIDICGEPTSWFDMLQITGTPTFVGDVHAALAILINRQCNLIAARTRRGAGNWCVVSPTALTILISAATSAFARVDGNGEEIKPFSAKTSSYNKGVRFVGTLNNALKIYCNQYASDNTHVLVGYKGNNTDTGSIYAPYKFLQIDNDSSYIKDGIPTIGFKRTDSFFMINNTQGSLGNAADYLGLVGINTNSLSFL